VKTAILFPFRLSLPSRCRRLTRPSPEKGKAATQTQGTRATTPHPRSQAIKKPAGGGEAEGGGGNRKRSERRASLLACPNPQSPSSLSPQRWTSSSISSSARPGELPPRAVAPFVSAGIRVFWVWIWVAPRWLGGSLLGWVDGCRCLGLVRGVVRPRESNRIHWW